MTNVKYGRSFFGLLLIPMVYVFCAFWLDFIFFTLINEPFPKQWYVSLAFVVVVALVVSCIPRRSIQFIVCLCLVAWQTTMVVANLLAFMNIHEIFILESTRSFREIFAGAGAQRYDGTMHYVMLGLGVVTFLIISFVALVKYRHEKAGYPFHAVVGVVACVMVVSSGIYMHLRVNNKEAETLSNLEKLVDPYFSMNHFTNRGRALYSFGTPMFYFNNVLSLMGFKSMSSNAAVGNVAGEWHEVGDYEYTLGSDYNLVMLMMETMEYDAINPVITPNLSKIKSKSTWVDGYYGIERTAFTEYVSLNGSYNMGNEMWRDYMDVQLSQSLPNIFKRSWGSEKNQVGAFHNYDEEFYNRDVMFTPERNGFDFVRDQRYYGASIEKTFQSNSDADFMRLAVKDIAPTDKKFLSYYLGISTHGPHFQSKIVSFDTKTNSYSSIFGASLDYVLDNFLALSQVYPKLIHESQDVRTATVAFLVGVREYDTAIGILVKHLEDTGLANKTALVLYSDHYDYLTYNNKYNAAGGGLLSRGNTESPIGEKLNFMIYNPKDGKERKITSFMSNNDIYKTVCQLFGVRTHENFTLGSSVLERISKTKYDISVGIAFYSGVFFGTDLKNPNLHFSTRDFKTFITNQKGVFPSAETIAAFKARMEIYAGTILKLRSYYDANAFKDDLRSYYEMA